MEAGPLLCTAEDALSPPLSFCLPITPPGSSEMLRFSSRFSTWPWPSATQQSTQGKFQQKHALRAKGVWLVWGAGVCQHSSSRWLTTASPSGAVLCEALLARCLGLAGQNLIPGQTE